MLCLFGGWGEWSEANAGDDLLFLLGIAIAYHEAKVLKWVDELDRQIEKRAAADSVVNATDFLLWFTFDTMGDFTFSKSFSMLETQRWHHIVLKTQNARSLLGPADGDPLAPAHRRQGDAAGPVGQGLVRFGRVVPGSDDGEARRGRPVRRDPRPRLLLHGEEQGRHRRSLARGR